ncbi:hypothetical protein Dsin_011366 [Dipteronia sinensis]|uniref:Uncharacterized protein n=1 Tax=Dipteronia sinensis TaxID=43782 RepID=A0AAE0AU44_9ROSI|nr:hypothetical protein Dsin_011366 [Dipteronia sinensis]
MIEYLNPLQLFRQSQKRTYYMPVAVFLGLSFRDKSASVAISDKGYNISYMYGVHRRDKLMDKLVDVVQSLKKDCGYDLEGIIVADNSSVVPPVNIHNLMEDLCKKLNFQSLKYTCWKDNITPWSPELKCSRFGYSFCGSTLPLGCSIEKALPELQKRLERNSAQPMLQAFLHVFNTLHMERDEESMGRFKEREYSKRKVTRRGSGKEKKRCKIIQ